MSKLCLCALAFNHKSIYKKPKPFLYIALTTQANNEAIVSYTIHLNTLPELTFEKVPLHVLQVITIRYLKEHQHMLVLILQLLKQPNQCLYKAQQLSECVINEHVIKD